MSKALIKKECIGIGYIGSKDEKAHFILKQNLEREITKDLTRILTEMKRLYHAIILKSGLPLLKKFHT